MGTGHYYISLILILKHKKSCYEIINDIGIQRSKKYTQGLNSKIEKLVQFVLQTQASNVDQNSNENNSILMSIRETIYDLMVNDYWMPDVVEYMFHALLENEYINDTNQESLFKDLLHILHQYHNNYREIFHVEHLILYLINLKKNDQ